MTTHDSTQEGRVLRRLVRIRWATRFTLAFGVTASGVANVLHADDNFISRTISAWPPVALLLTVELISRVPVHRFWMAVVRLAATSVIAGIAAWISYWHMAAVTANYGETGSSAYLLPLTVDGLVVVASISLVELTARIRDLETATAAITAPATRAKGAVPVPRDTVGNGDRSLASQRKTRSGAAQTSTGVSDWLLDRARKVIATHRDQTGREITRDELRERLRIKTETASQLLQLLRPTASDPATPVDAEVIEVEPVTPQSVPALPVVNRALIGMVSR